MKKQMPLQCANIQMPVVLAWKTTMNIIKAERAVVKFSDGVEVDGYRLPNGELRVGMMGASAALGFKGSWLKQLSTRQMGLLQELGYEGKILRVELETINGGGAFAETISISDFKILATFAASKGKVNALKIISKNANIQEEKKKAKKSQEKIIQTKMCQKLNNAAMEVATPAGNIDILTSSHLIEVKEWKRWKEGIGQVLCYGDYYPSHQKHIHFFGTAHQEFIDLVRKHCDKHSISISWEI
jgi:hypothetical protein